LPYDDIRNLLVGRSEEVADDVLAFWQDLSQREPWLRLPEDTDMDFLPVTLESLASAALDTTADPQVRRDMLAASAQHGSDRRREDGFTEPLLHRELHMLRRALWDTIRRNFGDTGDALDAMLRIEAAHAVSVEATLFGFHNGPPDEVASWDEVCAALLREFPPPLDR